MTLPSSPRPALPVHVILLAAAVLASGLLAGCKTTGSAGQDREFLSSTERPEWVLVRVGLMETEDGAPLCVYAPGLEQNVHRGGGLLFGAFGVDAEVRIGGSEAVTPDGAAFEGSLPDFSLNGPDALAAFSIRPDANLIELTAEVFCLVDGQRYAARPIDEVGRGGGPTIIIKNDD